ncbi:MAG: hypothetical protein Q8O67_06415 [Deltaproteobacteria bacterium]|nr:hypothetical protein [Deltaproteobacteria bacterium]
MARRFLALLTFATSLVAVPAIANDLDDCDDMSLPSEEADVDVDIAAEVEALVPADVVVPCAMVESGVLGPACQDAAFYVVNQHGTLLCRVELAVFTQAGSLPVVEQSPAAPAASQGSSVVAAVVPVLPPALPAGSMIELERTLPESLLHAADAHLWDRPRPS